MLKFILVIAILGLSFNAYAQDFVSKAPSAEDDVLIDKHNQEQARQLLRRNISLPTNPNARPFAEYEENGYLIFSSNHAYESLEAKRAMAKNLPDGVTILIYTAYSSESMKQSILREYAGYISPDRIKVLYIGDAGWGSNFWSRDGIPVPIVYNNSSDLRLVDAKYYHKFEPDAQIAKAFGAQLVRHDFYFEGGNFMPNRLGDCITVERNELPTDEIFKSHYACKRIIRLPKIKGIGHVDESVKFMSDKVVLTDAPEYKDTLARAGYEVHMLPRPAQPFETYVNALNLNGVLYLPVFGGDNDNAAIAVYESFGLKVVPIRSTNLSNKGKGSIHCITMNYPKVNLNDVVRAMGASLL